MAAGKPSIYPIYWSGPQMQAREDANMVAVRRFLDGFWQHESEGRTWFDPSRDTAYPDRIRRSAPGTTSKGLSPHTDAGSLERWLLPACSARCRTTSRTTTCAVPPTGSPCPSLQPTTALRSLLDGPSRTRRPQPGRAPPARAPGLVTQDLYEPSARNRHPTARLVTARDAPVLSWHVLDAIAALGGIDVGGLGGRGLAPSADARMSG